MTIPRDAPDWVVEHDLWAPPTSPPTAPFDSPPTAPPPAPPEESPSAGGSRPSTSRARMVALLVVVGLFGSLFGGALSTRFAGRDASTAAPPATLPFSGAGRFTPNLPAPGAGGAGAAGAPAGVVDIDTTSTVTGQQGAGTGMVLTSTGDVLTNNHVIEGATEIVVTRTDTGRTYGATVIGTDPIDDVALLHLANASGLPTAPLGTSSAVAVGDAVVAAGNAGGRGGAPMVVTGTVQALDQTITVSEGRFGASSTLRGLIQTDAPLQPGDSGGPMLEAGKVIGINTAASANGGFDTAGSEGFAVPIDKALAVVAAIRAGKETNTIHLGSRGFLGVSASQPDQGAGALVGLVQPGSPAQKAGLAVGDVITAVDGAAVRTPKDLTDRVHAHRPGDRVTITWTDAQGRSTSAAVTLATGTPD